jgi:serine/threonine protein phosphatase PrpC
MGRQTVPRCPACREVIRPEDLYCEACGAPIAASARPAITPVATPDASYDGQSGSSGVPDEREHVEIVFPDLAGITDRGLRRPRNEDALALAALEEQGARVMVVCDGVSTSAEAARAALVAAQATLDHLVEAVLRGRSDLELAMKQAVNAAQAAVCEVPYGRDGQDGVDEGPPATTLVAALLMRGRATLGWLGDSRAYFVGSGDAWQLSHDDTWAEELLEPHPAADGGAALALRAHVLTRWLGSDRDGEPEVSITTFLLPVDGCLLLCSDGLWNYAPAPSQMRELVSGLAGDNTPLHIARGLVEFARTAGGADNVTVAVATV